ncbi:MAG: SH3 domain-containing protein [Ardenticatenia bacterium]|nr:SH3 domain-containing protein [Ardenticatenia bacterium]
MGLLGGLMAVALVACQGGEVIGLGEVGDRPPKVIITRPPSGVRVPAGQVLEVQSTATDDRGVVRVELFAGDRRLRSDVPPEQVPQFSFTVVQRWVPDTPGEVIVKVVAFDTAGQQSPVAAVLVEVVGPPPTPPPTPRPTTPSAPPATPTATGQEGLTGTVVARALNVRAGPSTAFAVVHRLRFGDPVVAVARNDQGDWVLIRISGERTGWVAARYLEWQRDVSTLPVWSPER